MSDENKNNEDADFQDFAEVSDNIELDSDLSAMDEDAIEKALQNIVSQMADDSEDSKETNEAEEKAEDEITDKVTDESETLEPEKEIQDEQELDKNTVQQDGDKQKQDNIQTQDEVKDEQKSEENEAKEDDEKDNIVKETSKTEVELSQWEELNSSNDVVKKYIVYISKDFVPYVDKLSIDERSAYINDAIQQKLDLQDEKKQAQARRNAILHFIVAAIIIIAVTPLGIIFANKAIMATFENYKYSQENFEKLYKHRFEKNKAYMRSLQYNQEYEKKAKASASN